MTEKITPTSFRIPPDLREWLPKVAQMQGRSVNNYVVWLIRQAVEAAERQEPKP